MLCSYGRGLKQTFDSAVRTLADAEKAMADPNISFLVRDQRFQKAQTNRKSAADAFLEHKANCATCRARDSAIRPRFPSAS